MRSAGLELPSVPIGCSPRGSAMKRPFYYLLCAIACTSMVSATMPMAAIAEAIQSQETAEQQAQSADTNSDTDKPESGTNTNATADTAEEWHRNIHRHKRRQHEKRRRHHRRRNHHPHPIPPSPDQPRARGNLRHVTNHLRPLRHGNPKRRHLHRLVERRPGGHRDDLPRNPNQRLVPGQGAHGRAHLLGRRQP